MSASAKWLGILNPTLILFALQGAVQFSTPAIAAKPHLEIQQQKPEIKLAQSPNVGSILLALPRPQGSPAKPGLMFSANAYNQQALNFQAKNTPESVAQFYQSQLPPKGYTERPINTNVGAWGFNLVFDPATPLPPKTAGKTVVLVIQGTMLGPGTINVNSRFEEI